MKTRANRQLCVGLKTNYKQLKDIKKYQRGSNKSSENKL